MGILLGQRSGTFRVFVLVFSSSFLKVHLPGVSKMVITQIMVGH